MSNKIYKFYLNLHLKSYLHPQILLLIFFFSKYALYTLENNCFYLHCAKYEDVIENASFCI